MTEAEFQRAVVELAKWCGWLVFHPRPAQRSGSWATHFDGDAGFPDLVLAHAERGVVFAELKAERGRVSPGQRVWLNTLEDAEQTAVVWRPSDWEAIVSRLQGTDRVR